MVQHGAINSGSDVDDPFFEDTVTLLQAEIDRLQAELLARDEIVMTTREARQSEADSQSDWNRRLEELHAEIALRDETIEMLWEHLRTVEETQIARQTEWDQAQRMIEGLEQRLLEGALPPMELGQVAAEQRERADSLALELERLKTEWSARRQQLEGEIARLSSLVDKTSATEAPGVADSVSPGSEPRLAAEIEVLQARLKEAERERDEALARLEQDPSRSATEGVTVTGSFTIRAADLSPDERIRALRQHLQEVHEREKKEQANGQMIARLSRLWKVLGS
jgi:hypothetical protein